MPETVLNTPEGEVEIRYNPASNPEAPMMIVLHPHPEHGGTMNNKVVYSLYQTFSEQGFHVVRFNFRGVGKSSGHFDFGEGELRDAVYVMEWMKKEFPKASETWITGFSFGAWVALQLMKKHPEVAHFICAGPPANVYDFRFMLPFDREGLFIQGTLDEIVYPPATQDLADKISRMSDLTIACEMIEGADHFFTGKLDEFSAVISGFIEKKRGAQ